MDSDRISRILAQADSYHEQASGQKKRKAPDLNLEPAHKPSGEQSRSQPDAPSTSNSTSTVQSANTRPPATVPEPRQARKAGRTAIIVNAKRQKRNRIVTMVRVPVEYEQIEPDFITGATTCVLFLQLKYHRIHPEYIGRRIERLGRDFEHRILMLKVEEDDRGFEDAIKELTRVATYCNLTLVVVWNDEDAARYLRNLKLLDTATPKAIMGQSKTSYEDQLHDVVTSVRGMNKNNATTLVSTYGSLRDAVINCEEVESARLEDIIGWGPVRAKAFKNAINAPFLGS